MSENRIRHVDVERPSVAAHRRDRGMTLPELLVAITLMGLIVTVLSSTIVVTLRQQSGTEGRVNVARAEQSVSLWMPADLASADEVFTDPALSPCGATTCPGGIDLRNGSNVVMMSWYVDANSNGEGLLTNVSYHFAPSAEVGRFELSRIECSRSYVKDASGTPVLQGSWTCDSKVVLTDLDGPPNDEFGNPVVFVPGVTSPTWVIRVTEPLAPDAIAGPDGDGPLADPSQWKDANRVIVTIDGGGSVSGAGGGRNQISITAGGTTRQEINAQSMLGAPSFVAAKSRCGGPITLVIDESGSIGSNITLVQAAVRDFVQALRGTPVQIQIVTFTEFSRVLGAPGEWRKYFDMTDPVQADTLYNTIIDPVNGIKLSGAGGSGFTNWEEGLYRVAYNPDGTFAISDLPQTLVFFTDGIPNRDRNVNKTAPWNAPNPVGYPTSADAIWGQLNRSAWPSSSTYNYGSAFHQVAYNRAEWIATQLRGKTKLIGVGVGDFSPTSVSSWRYGPAPADRTAVSTRNRDILADLIVGEVITRTPPGRSPQMGELVAGQYVNPDTAELYIPDWSLLPEALRAVALGQCAGTITMQTRSAVPDASGSYPYLDRPVRYLAQSVKNPDGTPGKEEKKYVETNVQFTARTFDMEIPGGAYVDVEMVPMDFSDLASRGYTTNRWECTIAGVPVASVPTVPTANPTWDGFAIRVGANRAVSCTHFVNPP
jgi:prepilin-type N-terminal cleavage/methylation domain-containing protein